MPETYEKTDTLAVQPLINCLVLRELVETGAQRRQITSHRLKKMRKIAAGSEHEAEVDWLIAEQRADEVLIPLTQGAEFGDAQVFLVQAPARELRRP